MFSVPTEQTTAGLHIPAPVLGIDNRQSLGSMDPKTCVFSFNLQPTDYGVSVRKGYVEWANQTSSTSPGDIPSTVMPFSGLAEDRSDDKLFLCDEKGIWEVTTQDIVNPTLAIGWTSSAVGAGRCSYLQYVDVSGGLWLLVCDEVNGYYTYELATTTWTKVAMGAGGTQIAGVDPADFVFVMEWNGRLYFIERDTSTAWYLATDSLFGTATAFNFGNKHPNGGYLAAMYSWSVDSGSGVNDLWVGVSSAGDISMWNGSYPGGSDFSEAGTWYVGDVPTGRRIGLAVGGDLYILTGFGLLGMSSLLGGRAVLDPDAYLTAKIASSYRELIEDTIDTWGWFITVNWDKNQVVIGVPESIGLPRIQMVFNLSTLGWAYWRDLPMDYAAAWQDGLYFVGNVDSENRVYKMSGGVEDVRISGSPAATAISWSMLSSYTDFGEPARFKRVQLLRPVFIVGGAPSYNIEARYDFDLLENASEPAFSAGTTGLWNVGLWDAALWGGGGGVSQTPTGAAGLGRFVAYGLRGVSAGDTTLIGVDVLADPGGLL